MKNAIWYLQRLQKMPPREYPYRIKQAFNKRFDHLFYLLKGSGKEFPETELSIKKSDISQLETDFPRLKATIISFADDIVNHNFNIFGINRSYGKKINWHLDPKTGKSWPLKFWGQINYRDSKEIGGIKFAWELNRLHHLPFLAIAFQISGKTQYKKEVFAQLESWLDSNPYPKGINWISGIELGIRIVNLVYALKYLGEKLEPAQLRLVNQFISLHGSHLHRYPSKYSSCANHTISEALGLFIAGLVFSKLSGAKKWKREGKKILEREVGRQIYPDGSSFEHSVPYLHFVVEHYLVYYLLCHEYGEDYETLIEQRLKASLDFISHTTDENGNYFQAGDNDDGHLLRLDIERTNPVISLLNTGAVLFQNPQWILKPSRFDPKSYLLLGPGSKVIWQRLQKSKSSKPVCRKKYFDFAGFAVYQKSGKNGNLLFAGNSGPLGLPPLAGHGHADALSFWLTVNHKPVLVDPGTYLYHSGGKWRDFFRSTAAHNTITVDGLSQATMLTDFIFKDFYQVVEPKFSFTQDGFNWSAEHNGYQRLADPVFHRREVGYSTPKNHLTISDFITCKQDHLIESFFHFHPDCQVALQKSNILVIREGKMVLKIIPDEQFEVIEIKKGNESPLTGWYSSGFNCIEECCTVRFAANINSDITFTNTLFIDEGQLSE